MPDRFRLVRSGSVASAGTPEHRATSIGRRALPAGSRSSLPGGFLCHSSQIDLFAQPADGWLFYEFPNRGTKRAIQRINTAPPNNLPKTLADTGNGYLLRQGYTLVWSGWQGDLVREAGRMLADLPVPLDGGKPITGLCREEYWLDAKGVPQEDNRNEPLREVSDIAFVAGMHYPAANLDPAAATLTVVRARRRSGMRGEDAATLTLPRYLDDRHIEISRPAGFRSRQALCRRFIYPRGRDPVVMGVGLAGMRDIVGFLRHDSHDVAGNAPTR